jgi:hypothetical protein
MADPVLNIARFKQYIDEFNRHDNPTVVDHIANEATWSWMEQNIPFFECPDEEIEKTYYFRWWTYRKHIKLTPDGFVITEFLPPEIARELKHNAICCAAGHHIYEGRWLHDPQYLDDYSLFWFRGGGDPRLYSFWAADALYARYLVIQNKELVTGLLPDLVTNYQAWEETHQDPSGLFWQEDQWDGMECSISGLANRQVSRTLEYRDIYGGAGAELVKQYRPTINSYMYGDAVALARIALMAGQDDLAGDYQVKAARLKHLLQTWLWNGQDEFFESRSRDLTQGFYKVRELLGYVPWYFNLPDHGYEAAWKQLMDPQGFYAPFGPTTAERRHPLFRYPVNHRCLWNGPSWPYATTQTLVALANLLNSYSQSYVGKADYFHLLKIYTLSQRQRLADGTVMLWIDEDLDPDTGEWLARQFMYQRGDTERDRGRDYNHSAYCDLIITGLVGLRPRADRRVEINPLLPQEAWSYFCLDQVLYHGRWLTVLYDETGQRYHKGTGLRVFADGIEIAASDRLSHLYAKLP